MAGEDMISNNSNDDIEVDLEELLLDEDMNDEGDLEEEEDINELAIFKDLIEKS